MIDLKKYCFIFAIAFFLLYSCTESTRLFQPTDDSWIEKGDAKWVITDSQVEGSLLRGTGFIMTKDRYDDFVLELEFFPDDVINSGVFVRCKDQKLSYSDCYEMNIWDFHPEQNDRTGAIVSRATPLKHIETYNKWNTYKIKCKGNRIQSWINGILMADITNDDLKEGHIGLQADQIGVIRFRNIKLKEL